MYYIDDKQRNICYSFIKFKFNFCTENKESIIEPKATHIYIQKFNNVKYGFATNRSIKIAV